MSSITTLGYPRAPTFRKLDTPLCEYDPTPSTVSFNSLNSSSSSSFYPLPLPPPHLSSNTASNSNSHSNSNLFLHHPILDDLHLHKIRSSSGLNSIGSLDLPLPIKLNHALNRSLDRIDSEPISLSNPRSSSDPPQFDHLHMSDPALPFNRFDRDRDRDQDQDQDRDRERERERERDKDRDRDRDRNFSLPSARLNALHLQSHPHPISTNNFINNHHLLTSTVNLHHHHHHHPIVHPAPQIQRPSHSHSYSHPPHLGISSHSSLPIINPSSVDRSDPPPIDRTLSRQPIRSTTLNISNLDNSSNQRHHGQSWVLSSDGSPSRFQHNSSSSTTSSSQTTPPSSSSSSSFSHPHHPEKVSSQIAVEPSLPPPSSQLSLLPNRFIPTPSNRRMGFCQDAAREVVPNLPDSNISLDPSSPRSALDPLLQVSLIAIESIWPHHSSPSPTHAGSLDTSLSKSTYSLLNFVKEVLRRSRTNINTIKLGLFYLHQTRRSIRGKIAQAERYKARFQAHCSDPNHWNLQCDPLSGSGSSFRSESRSLSQSDLDRINRALKDPILSGRKTFLAALMCASKYLQDRNFSNRAWAKISGLPIQEVNLIERVFLGLIDYRLHVDLNAFDIWSLRLQKLMDDRGVGVNGSGGPVGMTGLARSLNLDSVSPLPHTSSARRESMPTSLPSTISMPSRSTLARPMNGISSSPSAHEPCDLEKSSSSTLPPRHDDSLETPARQQASHHPIASKGSHANASNLLVSYHSSSTSADHPTQRTSASAPFRQTTTPLISRPTGYSSTHYPSRPEPSVFDTPSKITGIPILGGLNRSVNNSGSARNLPRRGETMAVHTSNSTNRAVSEPPPRGMSYQERNTLTSGFEVKAMTAEEVIRLEKELLAKIAREKSLGEKEGASRAEAPDQGGSGPGSAFVSSNLSGSPDDLIASRDARLRLAEERRLRDEVKKEHIRKLIELRKLQSDSIELQSSIRDGAWRVKILENGNEPGEREAERAHDHRGGGVEPINLPSSRARPIEEQKIRTPERLGGPGIAPISQDFIGLTNLRQAIPRGCGEEEALVAAATRNCSAGTGSIHQSRGEPKIQRMMERRTMSSCGIQESRKLQGEVTSMTEPNPSLAALHDRGSSGAKMTADEVMRMMMKRNKLGESLEGHQTSYRNIYGEPYNGLNYSTMGGRPIY